MWFEKFIEMDLKRRDSNSKLFFITKVETFLLSKNLKKNYFSKQNQNQIIFLKKLLEIFFF